MKKHIIIAALLMAWFSSPAQVDTLPYTIGIPWFVQSHPFDAIYNSSHDSSMCNPAFGWYLGVSDIFHPRDTLLGAGEYASGGDLVFGFHLDSTIHLIGVATNFVYKDSFPQFSDYTITGISDSNKLDSVVARAYTSGGNEMSLLAEASMGRQRMTEFDRVYLCNRGYVGWTWGNPNGNQLMRGVREIYFDNEIDVSDSLYISVKYRGSGNDHSWNDHTIGWIEWHNPPVDNYIFPAHSYKVKHCAECPWIYGEHHAYPFLFPIIRRDCDTCPTVHGLEYDRWGANQAYFQWQAGDWHRDWQLSYGPAGTAPEDGTIVTCDGRQSGLITLDPDSHYVAYVRARCRFARFEYGPWSAPLAFSLNGGNGIDETGTVEVALVPNPATERVMVAAEGMESVELVTVEGATVLRRDCRGECSLDLKGLANGTYMVRVTTAKGVATRKLVVQ